MMQARIRHPQEKRRCPVIRSPEAWGEQPGIRNRYGAVRRQMHEGRMTICRQNGDVNFVGVPTGEKGVFVRAGLFSPSPPSNPKNIFLGTVYSPPSLCGCVRRCSSYVKRLLCAGVLFLGTTWSYRGLAERKNVRMQHHRQRGVSMRLPEESPPGLQARRAFFWKYERFLKEGGVQGREGTFSRKEKFPPSPHILVSS